MIKVSIIIPVFNRVRTIARALDSVWAQGERDWEAIVVDDGSTDGSASVVESWRQKYPEARVSLIRQQNAGAGAARNTGLAAAVGAWVAFLDSDDEWLPDHLSSAFAYLEQHPETHVVFADMEEWQGGRRVQSTFVRRKRAWPRINANPDAIPNAFELLLEGNFVPTPTVVARKAAVLQAGGFAADLKTSEDRFLWMRLSQFTHLAFLPKVSMRRHLSTDSLSNDWFTVCEARVGLLSAVAKLHPDYAARNADRLRKEIARYRLSAGYELFNRYRFAEARRRFAESFRDHPSRRAAFLWAATHLRPKMVHRLRTWKSEPRLPRMAGAEGRDE